MTPDDFDFISKMLKERSGLILTPDKSYLLESRLMPLARKNNMGSLEELVAALRQNKIRTLTEDVTEAMTTNESFFFRDIKPFDQFKEIVLPHLIKERAAKKSFRIWSAACSSGQEAYSLGMILREEGAKLPGWKYDIIGTDLSREMVLKAKKGLYSQFEVQRGLPIQLLVKYFKKQDDLWAIDPSVISMVDYKEWNLLQDLTPLGQFDVVFCRNVLIYFDQPTKTKILEAIAKLMPDDGFLYLGGAETVLGITEAFKPIPGQRGVYTVNRGGASAIKTMAAPMPSPIKGASVPGISSIRPGVAPTPALSPITKTPMPTGTISSLGPRPLGTSTTIKTPTSVSGAPGAGISAVKAPTSAPAVSGIRPVSPGISPLKTISQIKSPPPSPVGTAPATAIKSPGITPIKPFTPPGGTK